MDFEKGRNYVASSLDVANNLLFVKNFDSCPSLLEDDSETIRNSWQFKLESMHMLLKEKLVLMVFFLFYFGSFIEASNVMPRKCIHNRN